MVHIALNEICKKHHNNSVPQFHVHSVTGEASSSDDFEQSKNRLPFLLNTHQIIIYRLLDAIERLNDMTQRKFLEYSLNNIVVRPWSESWCPLRYQVYLVITMNIISGNHELGMTLCFDHVNENWMIICVPCFAGFLFNSLRPSDAYMRR